MKNRLHATLATRLIPVPWKDLFREKGLAWMAALELDPDGRHVLDSDLRLLVRLEATRWLMLPGQL